jgi:putative sulfotransferase
MSVPTFVVGTGRCGSTMLSNMLREHPKVLSISEFFPGVTDFRRTCLAQALSPQPINGPQFREMIAGIKPLVSQVLRHRVELPEFLYPVDNPQAHYSRASGVPPILVTMLPHLTADHDRLFDVLADEVNGWPLARIGEHYMRLFGWLARHFDKQLWVERSGGFLFLVEHFRVMFPDARFVHVIRDGRDAALSMREHQGFRLAYATITIEDALGVDPHISADRSHIDRVPEDLRPFLPECFDAEAFRIHRLPLTSVGGIWAQQVVDGLATLRTLSPECLLTLRYEDFFADPKGRLDALAAFLGEEFVDEEWSARCAGTVRPPRSTWRDLADEEACDLTEACHPGFAALREAGIDYEF